MTSMEQNSPDLCRHLSLALSCAHMGTWKWDAPDGSIIWDEQMHALFGVKPGGFDGSYSRFLEFILPEDRERTASEIMDAIHQRKDYDGEFRTLSASDGSIHFIRMRFTVPKPEPGGLLHAAGICWDVTERRQMERELATKSTLFNVLMKNLPDSIYFKDRQSRFIAVSDALAAHQKLEAAAMIGKTDFDFFSEEHAKPAYDDEQRVIATGEPIIDLEEKETWLDGSVTWVSTSKLPLRNSSGEIIGTFGLSRDITQRKQFEEELRAKNEMLEQDLAMARELQAALLPQRYPCFPHHATDAESAVHFCHFFRPSNSVSGDFFDTLDVSDNIAGLFICDVMGHGVRAALVAAIIRTLISELQPIWADPAGFMTQLNALVRNALKHTHVPLFASAFYLVADLAAQELRYANAGHPAPLHLGRRPGAPREKPRPLNGAKPGPALGLFDDTQYPLQRCPLSSHDMVLLFTDGLFEVESKGGEFYDYQRLAAAVAHHSALNPRELCEEIIHEVQDFSAGSEFSDDVCLVAMEIEKLQTK